MGVQDQALKGIKVLDFGWALVGSLTGKYLGDHGADVVRVESSMRPDATRSDRRYAKSSATNFDDKPWFAHLNTSKYSMALNLKHPRAKEVLNRLIRWADVVNENYTPGTMEKLGLGYEYMKKIKPDIIMMSGSVYGQSGPLAKEWGIDPNKIGIMGFSAGGTLTVYQVAPGYEDYAGAERGLMICDDDGTRTTIDETDVGLVFVERGTA